ncbi:protein neprosin-like [Phragmites australis]|uniref:protein neprosin-like n=1 Tax=Phragmites australis TaxID=29695 RepID=UPI002D77D862|nr:protein neprosin-like [Phragmites australis]
MASCSSFYFVPFLLLMFLLSSPPVNVSAAALASNSEPSSRSGAAGNATARLRPGKEVLKYKRIRALLKKLNKPSVKTIRSPDGDFIDCVPSHLQPAFDHPKLKDQKPLDPPERPKNYNFTIAEGGGGTVGEVVVQAWHATGEACPEGTVAMRRTTEEDMLRASSLRRYGRKPARRGVRHDSTSSGHEHAVGYVNSEQYYGAKASVNVWSPRIGDPSEFSLSQIWVISGSFGNDLNTIEAGWQISPELYGDSNPRFFTYWTTDAYQETGCYNHNCRGFVQTTNKIAIGAAITPESVYNGRQFDITLMIWKDPKHGHWWLELGQGLVVGYWPSYLFTHLARHSNMVQFGGEVVNTQPSGSHTATQMGSGHFPSEGFDRAAYFRNLQVVDWDNNLIPAANLKILADHTGCYDIQGGSNAEWGSYFYYGGPGRNVKCP